LKCLSCSSQNLKGTHCLPATQPQFIPVSTEDYLTLPPSSAPSKPLHRLEASALLVARQRPPSQKREELVGLLQLTWQISRTLRSIRCGCRTSTRKSSTTSGGDALGQLRGRSAWTPWLRTGTLLGVCRLQAPGLTKITSKFLSSPRYLTFPLTYCPSIRR